MTQIRKLQRPVTLVVGQTQTPEIDITGEEIIGINFDSHLTGTALTFQAALAAGGTFTTIQNNSGDLSLTVHSSKNRGLSADEASALRGFDYFKLTSGTIQATADAVITLITKKVTGK